MVLYNFTSKPKYISTLCTNLKTKKPHHITHKTKQDRKIYEIRGTNIVFMYVCVVSIHISKGDEEPPPNKSRKMIQLDKKFFMRYYCSCGVCLYVVPILYEVRHQSNAFAERNEMTKQKKNKKTKIDRNGYVFHACVFVFFMPLCVNFYYIILSCLLVFFPQRRHTTNTLKGGG